MLLKRCSQRHSFDSYSLVCLPWDHPVDPIVQSSPPREYRALELPHLYIIRWLPWHCRTGRRSGCAWLAFVCPGGEDMIELTNLKTVFLLGLCDFKSQRHEIWKICCKLYQNMSNWDFTHANFQVLLLIFQVFSYRGCGKQKPWNIMVK